MAELITSDLNSCVTLSADGKDANRLLLKGCCYQAALLLLKAAWMLTDCMDANELHGCLNVYFFGKQRDDCV